MTYCEYLNNISGEKLDLHKEYHDNHYGFPIDDDDKLFERLMFEINQAGLNLILPGTHSPACPVYNKIEKLKKSYEKERKKNNRQRNH